MKKILSWFGALALVTPLSITVSACSNSASSSASSSSLITNIDIWNYSTWGKEQGKFINTEFFKAVNSDKITKDTIWFDGSEVGYYYYYFEGELNSAFNKINSKIRIGIDYGDNTNYSIEPNPRYPDLVFDIFKTGLMLSVKGIQDGLTGVFNMTLKADLS